MASGLFQASFERPAFRESLSPLEDIPGPGEVSGPPFDASGSGLPDMVRRMLEAGRLTGLGPMAAVAGGFAQAAVEAAVAAGFDEAAAENGGDVVLKLKEEMILGIHPGAGPLEGKLAFRILPEQTPVSICSSSSRMGHSLSFGRCDLATVAGRDGYIADAAATLAGNLVKGPEDMQPAIDRLLTIPGVRGVLLVCGGQIGLGGRLPELIKNIDPETGKKITRDPFSPA